MTNDKRQTTRRHVPYAAHEVVEEARARQAQHQVHGVADVAGTQLHRPALREQRRRQPLQEHRQRPGPAAALLALGHGGACEGLGLVHHHLDSGG